MYSKLVSGCFLKRAANRLDDKLFVYCVHSSNNNLSVIVIILLSCVLQCRSGGSAGAGQATHHAHH